MNFAPARLAALAACALFAAPALSAAPQEAEEPADQAEAREDDGKGAPTNPAAKSEAKEDKRICRRIRADMSSRRKTRVCLTAEQWREMNRRR
ncbi:MAG: hypothetical protein RIC51_11110 [Erythrobacter sp.]|uniref:hypothetical protein n=1 Tax=Erythrobacter sp. TaxID=1042 RepID=UPI0032F027AA